ncbi:hypothetical protein MHBO_002021 [Bonamia ostreae]|uniref:V-SNARE coiled-coil homology domain-containing protein n=1 Tax=Bonamia ostreae TaxID=126728 RepID=A0ABV2AKX7_9EUKA
MAEIAITEDKIKNINGKIDDTKEIMVKNIENAIDNTEKLEEIEKKANKLNQFTDEFAQKAKVVKQRVLRNKIVTVLILVIIALVQMTF